MVSRGEAVKEVVPLGYAGNPAGYKEALPGIEEIFEILCKFVASEIL